MKKDIEWMKEEVWKQDIVMDKGYIYTDDLMSIINEVDEPEVLSQKFIDEHEIYIHDSNRSVIKAVPVDRLQNLIVPKQELPVIPKYVDEWWERDGDSVTLYGGVQVKKKHKFDLVSIFHDKGLGDYLSRVEDWIDENKSIFLELVNGKPYEVEEEQRYYVDLGDVAYVAKWSGDDQVDFYTDSISGSDEFELHLTEQEIKRYDERFWAFAEPVE